jgi:hypothetical protein
MSQISQENNDVRQRCFNIQHPTLAEYGLAFPTPPWAGSVGTFGVAGIRYSSPFPANSPVQYAAPIMGAPTAVSYSSSVDAPVLYAVASPNGPSIDFQNAVNSHFFPRFHGHIPPSVPFATIPSAPNVSVFGNDYSPVNLPFYYPVHFPTSVFFSPYSVPGRQDSPARPTGTARVQANHASPTVAVLPIPPPAPRRSRQDPNRRRAFRVTPADLETDQRQCSRCRKRKWQADFEPTRKECKVCVERYRNRRR